MKKKKPRECFTIVIGLIGLFFAFPTIKEFFEKRSIEKTPLSISSVGIPFAPFDNFVVIPDSSVIKNMYATNSEWVDQGDPAYYVIGLRVENLDIGSEVAISKILPIRINKYVKPLDSEVVDVIVPDPGCGGMGGSEIVVFEATLNPQNNGVYFASIVDNSNYADSLETTNESSSELVFSDYYYFSPGDVEIFAVNVYFTSPGEYEFQIGLDVIDKNKTRTIWFEEVYSVNILRKINVWKAINSGQCYFADPPGEIKKVASCSFIEPSSIKTESFFLHYSCFDPHPLQGSSSSTSGSGNTSCYDSSLQRIYVGGHATNCHNTYYNDYYLVIDGPDCSNPKVPMWKLMDVHGYASWKPEVGSLEGNYLLCPVD